MKTKTNQKSNKHKTVCVKTPKESIKKSCQYIKIEIIFLYTSNKQLEIEI